MLDIRRIRSDTERVRDRARAARRRRPCSTTCSRCDERRRALQTQVDELRARAQHRLGQAIGEAKRAGSDPAAAAIAAAGRVARPRRLDARGHAARSRRAVRDGHARSSRTCPTRPRPLGAREEDARSTPCRRRDAGVRVRAARPPGSGRPADRHGARRAHVGLALHLPARRHRARCSGDRRSYALDTLRGKGFTPVIPPVLVREEALVGTGFFPEAREQVYAVATPTDAVPGRHFRGARSRRCTWARSCPRRTSRCATAGSRPASGARPARRASDTRGIFRTHQFEKVEMFSFCHPDRSWDEHEWLLVDRGGDRAGARPALPRGQHRGRRPRQRRPPRSTTSRCGCPGRAATAS